MLSSASTEQRVDCGLLGWRFAGCCGCWLRFLAMKLGFDGSATSLLERNITAAHASSPPICNLIDNYIILFCDTVQKSVDLHVFFFVLPL